VRFIKKTDSPDFFEKEKNTFPLTEESSWKDFRNPCKTKFKKFLVEEQNGLCVYCECDLALTSSHIEHIKPRSKYKQLKFNYKNLTVSCDGSFLCHESLVNKQSCGHRKDDLYIEELFLNPTEQLDIEEYFLFNPETGAILPAEGIKHEKSSYMINVLNLDVQYLRDARKYAKEVLVDLLSSPDFLNDDAANHILHSELSEDREFISFLKHCFNTDQ